MGTIKSGFWSLSFILSPREFTEFIEYCTSLNIDFDRENLILKYDLYYNTLIAKTLPQKLLQQGGISFVTLTSFVCMLNIGNGIGFSITPANMVHWNYNKQEVVRITDWAIRINLQKSVSINKEDEKGKYFVYEDIQAHSPLSYPLYQKLITWIKSETKLLRFTTKSGEVIKSPVRISQQVATDMNNSWTFMNFGFQMISFN